MTALLTSGPRGACAHLVLAHGAGAPMSSPFLESLTQELGNSGVRVSRFEFAYMAARRSGGGRRPPPRIEVLADEYLDVISQVQPVAGQRLFIGGKSMGGRVASLIAGKLHAERIAAGLIAVGYPFHPPRKPNALRVAQLLGLKCPMLIVQGTRDPFGNFEEAGHYRLPTTIEWVWLADGDHDLKPRRASGHTAASHIASAARAIVRFVTPS